MPCPHLIMFCGKLRANLSKRHHGQSLKPRTNLSEWHHGQSPKPIVWFLRCLMFFSTLTSFRLTTRQSWGSSCIVMHPVLQRHFSSNGSKSTASPRVRMHTH